MKTILVPVDFSDATEPVVSEAIALAERLQARVILSHVVQPMVVWDQYSTVIDELQRNQEKMATTQLEQLRQRFGEYHLQAETRQFFGTPGREIVDEAFRIRPDLIVIGSHGHTALHDLLTGSTAAYILRHSPAPVVVVPIGRRQAPGSNARRVVEAITQP